jgi:hypothetical protein
METMTKESTDKTKWLLNGYVYDHIISNIRKHFIQAIAVVALFLTPGLIWGQSAPDLGSASSFAVFTATGAFNNSGATHIVGDIGTNVGAFSGFPPGIVIGQIHVADPASAQAATDVKLAYSNMSTITCGSVISTTMGSGQSLLPNVYCLGAASTINGDLILDGQGDPNSLFIFKIDGALATTVNSRVLLTNGASICNVYWQVNGQVDLGNNSLFQGTILANGAINLLFGATLNGRALSRAGAISLNTNTVNIPAQPSASVTASGPTIFCAGGSVILTADSSSAYLWSTGATTQSITVTTAGNYFVRVSNGCFSTSDTIAVIVNPLPNANAGADQQLTCLQTSVVLNGSSSTSGVTFSWVASGGGNIVSGANTATPTVNTAGTYTLTVTNTTSGCSSTDVAVVTTNGALPNVNAGADKQLTCLQTSVVLNGSSSTSGVTFSWVASGGGNIVSGANTATPTVNAAGTYTLTVSDTANNCSANDVAVVTTNTALPNVNAGADKQLTCLQTSVVLNGSSSTSGVTFSWVASGGGNIVSGANTATPTVNTAGTYTLTVTNTVTGCSATDVAVVTTNTALPNANAGIDQQLTCLQTSVVLNGSSSTSGVTFSWVASGGGNIVSGANTATPTVNTAGTYTLTVTNTVTGCSATDVVVVTTNTALPNVNAGTDQQLTCLQTSVVLNGSSSTSGVTFSWIASGGGNIVSGANTATPTVNTAGTYTLTVTNTASGCSATDVAVVTLNGSLPNVNAGADQQLTCLQTSVVLNGSSSTPGVTFSWVASGGGNIVSGANTATPTVNAAGIYTLTVSDTANNCSANDVAVVTTNTALPNANAGADKQLTCLQTSVVLNGSSSTSGVTFNWVASGGGNIVSGANTASPTVNAAGTYTLTVTDTASGCSANDVAVVTTNTALPNANAGADQQLTCLQTLVILNGSSSTPGVTFSWVASGSGNITLGANTATPTVNTAGTYTLTVTDTASGCSATDVVVVTTNGALPNANAGADQQLTCLQTSVVLNGSSSTSGVTFSWVASGGGNIISGANTASPTVNTAGTYTLTVTDTANNCSAGDLAVVTINGALPNVNAGADKQLTCLQTSVVLSGSSSTPGVTFSWVASGGGNIVSGANTATPTVNTAGTYTLIVTNPVSGCSASDVAVVTINTALPDVNAGADKQLTCLQTSVVLNGSSSTPGVTFSWVASGGGNIISGANTATPTVNTTGTYTLIVTDTASGCSANDVAIVTSGTTLPNCLITGNDSFCTGDSTQLCAPSGAVSYLWSTGDTISCITVSNAGTFTVTVTDSSGCSSTCNKTISVMPLPSCLITGNDSLCAGSSTQLCAPASCVSYFWDNCNATSRCITVSVAGINTVTVTDSNGCSSTCSKTVIVMPLPNCQITGNDSICAGGTTQLWAPIGCGCLSYLWNTGATTRSINVNSACTNTVTVTNSHGCSSTCSKDVTVTPGPDCLIPGNDTLCISGSTQLCAPAGYASYLWSTGETTSCITTTNPGICSVTVTDTNGVTNTWNLYVTIQSATGIMNTVIDNSSFNVFPNPISESANIQLDLPEKCEGSLVLCDITGNVLYIVVKGTIEKRSQYILPMSEYPSGIYVLKLFTDKGTLMKKIVK